MSTMFNFHKNNTLTASNQSSVDSLVTSQSTSTSISDVGASQSSELSSHWEPPSPEQRLGSISGKRHSVFTLRSRSNTATSSTSSIVSPPPLGMPGQEASTGRSLFKGKKGKRLSGSFSHSLHAHDYEEPQTGSRRASMLRKTRKQSDEPENPAQLLKNRISSPFDFQHLTHTNRHHFAALQEATDNELAAGFRAVRASQAPRRNLTVMKSGDLHSPSHSAEDLVTPERRSISAMELRPPPDFVDHVIDAEESAPQDLRQSRSVESFSRPGMHRHTQSANPPARVSSRRPSASSDQIQDNTTQGRRQSGVWDHFDQLSPTRMGGPLPSMAEEMDSVGHALTTPDNSAIHPTTPPFSPGLEDVAEEPERFVSPRPAPLPPSKSPKSPRSPMHGSFSSSHRPSVARSHGRKDSYVLPRHLNLQNSMGPLSPMSPMSETLASPALGRRHSIRKPSSARRASNTWRVIEESWEDDIDYIYDNALEADCGSEWEEPSANADSEGGDHRPAHQVHRKASGTTPTIPEEPVPGSDVFTGDFRSSLLVPNTHNVPELEPRSAVSASTADTRVHTPSDYFNPNFSFTPSLPKSHDDKEHVSREDMYDDLLADYEGSDRHYPLLEPTQSGMSSARSSQIRASKSSYDSSLRYSGHRSGSWSASVRRSGSSAGSLPELVHSSRAPRQDIAMAVNKLAEHVDSFSPRNTEEDDITPPGHASQERTFFASDDEHESADPALDAAMKTSLELTRRGSKESFTRTQPKHKYSSSEAAPKLLAPNRLSRAAPSHSRAGSVPQKSPYLSLFPTPPKSAATSPISPLSPATN